VPAVLSNSAEAADGVPGLIQLGKKVSNILASESSITAGGDAVCLYSSVATPPPQGVGMNMKEPGHLPDGQHLINLFAVSHIFFDLLSN
jgi:hypothetical protein